MFLKKNWKTMITTKDTLKKHLEQVFMTKNGVYYFGNLTKESSDPTAQGKLIVLERDIRGMSRYRGYLDMRQERRYSVSHITDDETFDFQFTPSQLEIIIQEPQITAEPPIHSQSIQKEDWVTPAPITIVHKGDYSSPMRQLDLALIEFKQQGHCELWLPLRL